MVGEGGIVLLFIPSVTSEESFLFHDDNFKSRTGNKYISLGEGGGNNFPFPFSCCACLFVNNLNLAISKPNYALLGSSRPQCLSCQGSDARHSLGGFLNCDAGMQNCYKRCLWGNDSARVLVFRVGPATPSR